MSDGRQIDGKSISEVDRLQQLFAASQCVMKIKTLQSNVALEYFEELAKTKVDRADYEALQQELKVYRETIDSQDTSLADRLKDLSHQVHGLKKELDGKENDLQKVKKRAQEAEKRADAREREFESLTREVESLRQDLESHRTGFDDTFSEREDFLQKLRTKNTQIQNLLDEIREFELENKDLKDKVTTLKSELNDATIEMQKSSQDIRAMKSQLQEIQVMNHSLLQEKEQLMQKLESQQEVIDKFTLEDDRMANKFSAQVDRVIEMMNEKDVEIKKLQSILKVSAGRETLSEFGVGKDAEAEIRLLKEQLEDAGNALHQQNLLIHFLQSESRRKDQESQVTPTHSEDESFVVHRQIESLENELKAKDGIISDLRSRNQMYEQEHYGLGEAVAQLEATRASLSVRDNRISELITQINQMGEELNDSQAELEYVRECASVKGIDCNYERKEDSSSRSDKLQILRLQQQIVRLEDQKISIEEESRKLRSHSSHDESSNQVKQLNSRIFLLEKENADLKQGMKEILIGLQESDSRSDVTVECPSLERVCQLFESRSISESLANVISLKAELDLLRGYNEQLRTELKRVRCEHLNVLSLYTEDVLLHSEHELEDVSTLEASEGEVLQHYHLIQDSETVMSPPSPSHQGPQKQQTEENADDKVLERKEDKRVEAVSPHTSLSQTRSPSSSSSSSSQSPDDDVHPDDRKAEAGEAAEPMQAMHELAGEDKEMTKHVPLAVPSRFDVSTQTVFAPDPMPRGIKRQGSPTSVSRCTKCIRFARAFSDIHTRLNRMEASIRNGEDLTLQRIQNLQEQHKSVIKDFEDRMTDLKTSIGRKDLLIQHLKEKVSSSRRIPRRQTFTITPSDESAVAIREEDKAINDSVPSLQVVQLQEKAASDTDNERNTEIIENVIECLHQRISHKNNTIRDYQRMLQETKDSFEREINCMLDQKRANQEEDVKEYSLKAIIDNEELQKLLSSCLKELEDLKQEASCKVSELESVVQEKSERIAELENEIESLQRKGSLTQNTNLRNQVNQLKDEIKSKEKTIANLSKNLKEERLLRVGAHTVTASVKKGKSTKEEDEKEKEVSRLREEIEGKKRLIRENELSRWESEKKMKDSLESAITRLKDKTEESEKLAKSVDRLKGMLMKRETRKVGNKKKKSVTFSTDQLPAIHRPASPPTEEDETMDEECMAMDEKRRRSYPSDQTAHQMSTPDSSNLREEELKILLQESLEREKLSALRLTSSQMHDVPVDQQLLQENAHLKVELRMAEFELKKRKQTGNDY